MDTGGGRGGLEGSGFNLLVRFDCWARSIVHSDGAEFFIKNGAAAGCSFGCLFVIFSIYVYGWRVFIWGVIWSLGLY